MLRYLLEKYRVDNHCQVFLSFIESIKIVFCFNLASHAGGLAIKAILKIKPGCSSTGLCESQATYRWGTLLNERRYQNTFSANAFRYALQTMILNSPAFHCLTLWRIVEFCLCYTMRHTTHANAEVDLEMKANALASLTIVDPPAP